MLRRQLVYWGTFTLLLGLFLAILKGILPHPYIHDKIWAILIFLAIATLLTSMLSIVLLKNDEFNSVSFVLGSTVLRILLSLLFVIVSLWGGDENILWFVLDFFTIYLLYLVFDIYSLITNLRLHLK